MKTRIFTFVLIALMTTIFAAACGNINPERHYPNPGYVQSDEILPSEATLESIKAVPDKKQVSVNEAFRVKVTAEYLNYSWPSSEVVSLQSKFTMDQEVQQTNVNEFIATREGVFNITAHYTFNNKTCSDTITITVK